MVHFACACAFASVFFGNDTGKIYEQLTKNTRDDVCLRVVCELLYLS